MEKKLTMSSIDDSSQSHTSEQERNVIMSKRNMLINPKSSQESEEEKTLIDSMNQACKL
jgi:hypothetical protein